MKCVFVLLAILVAVSAFAPKFNAIVRRVQDSETALFAHHPQKKIIKKKQDKRPKKHRLSDINRKNVNIGKCITKIEGAPAEFTLLSADEYAKVRTNLLKFWENGDIKAEWLTITDDEFTVTLPQNREPLPEGGVQKRPPLVRSGSV